MRRRGGSRLELARQLAADEKLNSRRGPIAGGGRGAIGRRGTVAAGATIGISAEAEGELSVEEIAVATGSNFERSRGRLRYARAKLRQLLWEFA